MAEVRGNQAQLSSAAIREPAADGSDALLARGVDAGREWARRSTQRALAWIEDHPGQALIIAVAAGFVAGKLLLGATDREDDED
jgi:ElaB/YqjD/DUF883 family membrane-anchored ribosome-binding protein